MSVCQHKSAHDPPVWFDASRKSNLELDEDDRFSRVNRSKRCGGTAELDPGTSNVMEVELAVAPRHKIQPAVWVNVPVEAPVS